MTPDRNYSALDRLMHRVAFLHPAVQLTAADVEASLYGGRFKGVPLDRPVFITSLPRAGTTLLLEALNRLPGAATHCYRDMPFVLAPILWDALSAGFRKQSRLAERAHGDGMEIGYDSPEAFEEIVWKAFWPEKFRRDRIELWSAEDEADGFRDFFLAHLRRIISVRSRPGGKAPRYVSKNNANIARIAWLRGLLPDCLLLIPFRDPVDQASSLLRQHQRFSSLHSQDPFSKRYMADIGHLEFGKLHRPIRFEGLNEVAGRYGTDTLDYWIAYWTVAFEHVLRFKEEVLLISYERACEDGRRALWRIAERLGLDGEEALNASASLFRPPVRYTADASALGPITRRARALHRELLDSSIV